MDYREFLRVLENKNSGRPVLFEPFLNQKIVEQIVWRTGSHVWDTPVNTVTTLIACHKNIHMDVSFIDCNGFSADDMSKVLSVSKELLPKGMKLVTLCHTSEVLELAQSSDVVCAIAVTHKGIQLSKEIKLPAIYIPNQSGSIKSELELAIAMGFSGFYMVSDYLLDNDIFTLYDSYNQSIALLGGIYNEFICSSKPADIYDRCKLLFNYTKNKGFAVGTGNIDTPLPYLQVISIFGVYQSLT